MDFGILALKNLMNKEYKKLLLLFLFLSLGTIKLVLFKLCITFIGFNIKIIIYSAVSSFCITSIVYVFLICRKNRWPLLVFYCIQCVYILLNMVYFFYFSRYFLFNHASALFTTGIKTAIESGFHLAWKSLLILIDLPVFILIVWKKDSFRTLLKKDKASQKITLAAMAIIVLSFFYSVYSVGSPFSSALNRYGDATIVKHYGLLTAAVNRAFQNFYSKELLTFKHSNLTVEKKSVSDNYNNIILLQLESIDSNVVNFKNNGEYIAPFLQSLSKSSIYYPYVLSYHKAGGTFDAETSIIESVEPSDEFPSSCLTNYNFPNSYAKILKVNGFSTQAFHGNTSDYWNRNLMYPQMGYEKFWGRIEMDLGKEGWGASDESVFNFVSSKVRTQESPFLYHIITLSSHDPFKCVLEYYKTKRFDNIKNERVRNYFTSVSYVDEQLSYFMNNTVFPKNTYIFIVGDHCPSIGDNNVYKEASIVDKDRKLEFVPLFIITPEKTVYSETSNAISFLDISPTILHASGVSYKIFSDGTNLLNPNATKVDIPFNGTSFDRNELYQRISNK